MRASEAIDRSLLARRSVGRSVGRSVVRVPSAVCAAVGCPCEGNAIAVCRSVRPFSVTIHSCPYPESRPRVLKLLIPAIITKVGIHYKDLTNFPRNFRCLEVSSVILSSERPSRRVQNRLHRASACSGFRCGDGPNTARAPRARRARPHASTCCGGAGAAISSHSPSHPTAQFHV